jgi:hypothetical protein
MTRRMVLVLGLVVVGLLVGATPAGATGNYTDPSGDSGSAGDITGVQVVSDPSSGQIIFRITGTNLSTAANMLTFLDIDSDANPTTGNLLAGGIDYFFGVDNSSYGFFRWSGTDWVDTPDSTVTITGGGNLLLISVNRREIGNTTDFNFDVFTIDQNDNNAGDDAPDDGMFNYSVDAGGPLITSVSTRTTPAKPRAGKRFVVAATAITLPPDGRTSTAPIVPDSYTCVATLNGKRIAGSGKGRCTFALPKTSKRKTLRVTVTANYQGAKKTKVLVFRVG